MPRTKNPFRRRTPSETHSWADVIRVLIEPRRQALKIVTHAEINGQLAGERPMILHESADTRHRKSTFAFPNACRNWLGFPVRKSPTEPKRYTLSKRSGT